MESMYAPVIQAVHAKFKVCERKDGNLNTCSLPESSAGLEMLFLLSGTYLSFYNLVLTQSILFEEGEPGRGTYSQRISALF